MEEATDLDDQGDWLEFNMLVDWKFIRVRIARAVMEQHFGATREALALAHAYLLDPERVHAFALSKVIAGVAYERGNPLVIGDRERQAAATPIDPEIAQHAAPPLTGNAAS